MHTTAQPRVFVEDVEGVILVGLADSELLEQQAIDEVDDELSAIGLWASGADVLLNFRDVARMSTALLAVVWKFARAVSRTGAKFRVCGITPSLLEVFRLTRFDRLLPIDDDEASALEAFRAGRTGS